MPFEEIYFTCYSARYPLLCYPNGIRYTLNILPSQACKGSYHEIELKQGTYFHTFSYLSFPPL